MKFSIIENDKPNLPLCQMKCDSGLAEHLNQYELTKFLNCHSVNLLIGKPGSGKTSLLYSLFKASGKNKVYKKVFHNIYLFMPSQSRGSLKDNIFDVLPDNKKYDELTYENLSDVLARIKGAEPYENNAIIFDDMGAFLKNAETKRLFKELVYNRRHYHTSIFFLCQSWLSVEKDLRKLFSNIFVFKVSKSEMDNLFNEVIEQKREHLLDIMKIAYDKPHQFLFINSDTGRLFKGFDEIKIENDEV
jgi:DNA replication protein DnaC